MAATGPSEGPSLCSYRAGSDFSTAEQQLSVGDHIGTCRGENKEIILMFRVWKKCVWVWVQLSGSCSVSLRYWRQFMHNGPFAEIPLCETANSLHVLWAVCSRAKFSSVLCPMVRQLKEKTTNNNPPKTTTKAPTKTKQTHQNQNKAEKHSLQTSLATDNALQILLTDSCGTYLEKAGIGVSDFTIISACNRSV